MKKVWPHEFFRLDFDAMLEEGKRQEAIHAANKGEHALTKRLHSFFADTVIALIISDDWVFEAASKFASDYAIDCFRAWRLTGQEVYGIQTQKLAIDERVVDFLARAHLEGAMPKPPTIDLPKASDFINLLELHKLSKQRRTEADTLYEETTDHEALQLAATLRAIRDDYEVVLPRILYVVRRTIKINENGQPSSRPIYQKLEGVSRSLDWYEKHVDSNHALYPVLGQLRGFYKTARNVGSHHQGLVWEPSSDEVVLQDDQTTVRMHVHKFQQRYRYIVYICEFGMRGILAAFCEREKGAVSNTLVQEYIKIFPEGFPEGEEGTVRFYSSATT